MNDKVMTSSNARMYREMYSKKLDAILVRENNNIQIFLFIDKTQDRYIIYIKVPSETQKQFYYDVVIEFSKGDKNKASLEDYNVRFYSNEPRFCFVFCYAYLQHDLFFKDLTSKMSKQALTKSAENTNPSNQIGYCKSIYFAYLIMQQRGLFDKAKWREFAKEYRKDDLLSLVEHATVKHVNRMQVEKDAKEDKKKFDRMKGAYGNTKDISNLTVSTSNTRQVTRTNVSSRSSSTKTVSRVRRH